MVYNVTVINLYSNRFTSETAIVECIVWRINVLFICAVQVARALGIGLDHFARHSKVGEHAKAIS